MINTLKSVLAVLILSTLTTTAYAGVGANFGYGSDYIFRGMTQTGGEGSAFGSVDIDMGGFYAGVWTGEVDLSGADRETDMYVGYAMDLGQFGVDISYIDYSYSGNNSLDGSEVWLSGSYGDMSVLYVLGQDGYDDYTEFGYKLPVGIDMSFGTWDNMGDHVKISRDFDIPVWGLGASVSYVDFTADSNSGLLDEDSIVFSISKSF